MRRILWLIPVIVLAVAACSGDGGTAPASSDLTTTTAPSTGGVPGTTLPSGTTQGPVTTQAADTTTAPATSAAPAGEPAPDFTLALGDGGSFSLSGEPKPVYLVFWAEWCTTCGREIPVIDAVASDYLETITFVAVAQNSTPQDSARRVGDWFSPDRLLWGYSDEIGPRYGVRGQPVSVLITGDDFIVDRWSGTLPESEIRARLDALAGRG